MKMKLDTNHLLYNEMVCWFEEHVGPVLHCKPIVMWQGQGWRLESPKPYGKMGWEVTIDDEKLATVFALRWA